MIQYQIGNKPFNRDLRESFSDIVEAIYRVLVHPGTCTVSKRPGWDATLSKVRVHPGVPLPISREDIINEVYLMFELLRKRYNYDKERKPRSLKDYILGYIPWLARDYIKRMEKQFITPVIFDPTEPCKEHPDDEVKFLFNGMGKLFPGVHLSGWEKQLLYLRHVEGKSYKDIAELVYKDKHNLKRQLWKIEEKIRDAYSLARYTDPC